MLTHYSARAVEELLPFGALLDALREASIGGVTSPPRHHHALDNDATMLLMPAWDERFVGVKLVNVFPGNSVRGQRALSSAYILASGETGEHLAILDGDTLTQRRTVATSVLGATYLARPDSRVLVVVGVGHIGRLVPEGYNSAFNLDEILLYDRDHGACEGVASDLAESGLPTTVVSDLAEAIGRADIVSCATLATEPVIQGGWLSPGTHLDLIGSFRPDMREADDECLAGAGVYVDTPVALSESGDLLKPMNSGALRPDQLRATLPDLCAGHDSGRRNAVETTIFKAVGSGLADLAAAGLVYRTAEHN